MSSWVGLDGGSAAVERRRKGGNLNRPKSGGLLFLLQHQEEKSRQVYGRMQMYALIRILVVEF